MQAVQIQIDNSDLTAKDAVLTVFNACPFPRSGVVSCYVDMPANMGYDAFSIQTPDGKKTGRLQVKEQFPQGTLVRNLQDISIELRSTRALCHVEVDDIPAFGYKTYHLVREGDFAYIPGTLAPETNVLENEHLRVAFRHDGTLDLTHKESGRVFTGLHYLEDTGETGHSWIHMEPESNETITSHGSPCSIALLEAGPLLARMRVEYRMEIPVSVEDEPGVDFREGNLNNTRRTKETKPLVVSSEFSLRAGAKRLDVKTSFENQCKHHRLRVVFPTRLDTDRTDSEAGYDVIARDIHVKQGNAYYGRPNPQYPMHRFVDMTDGAVGFAVVNNSGLREYEAMDQTDRPLAITLMRGFTYRNSPVFGRWETYPDMELAQCIGKFEWTYALYPHGGDWTNGVYEQAEDMNLPIEVAQAGPHPGQLPKSMSFLEVSNRNLQLTAFKRAEDHKGTFVVRLFNPTARALKSTLKIHKPIKRAWLTNLNEDRCEKLEPVNGALRLNVGKKKIVTVEFQM
jgi:alpha-mannosidase